MQTRNGRNTEEARSNFTWIARGKERDDYIETARRKAYDLKE